MPKPKLIIEKDVVVHKGKFRSTVFRHFRNRITGKRGVWEMVRRKMSGRIVAVVALTPKMEVVLIKIYRIPLKRYCIEACAGLADRKGESEKDLARRELLEETGYAVGRLEEMFAGPINSGLLKEEIVYFLGIGARKVQEPELEDAEDIMVLKVPLRSLRRFLARPPRGVRVDLKLWGVLDYLEHKFDAAQY